MHKLIFTFGLCSALLISACGGKSSNDSYCEYDSERFNMTIIDVAVDPADTNMYVVTVDFDGNVPYSDRTYSLTEIRDVVTTEDFVLRNHIRPGKIYKGVLYTLNNNASDCEEQIFDWDNKLK